MFPRRPSEATLSVLDRHTATWLPVHWESLVVHTSIPLCRVTNTLNDWNIHLVRTQKSMLHKCLGPLCFYNGSIQRMLFGSSSNDFHWQEQTSRAATQSLPVVFAVLQERMSVGARSVCAHVCIPACHGTSRDVVLHTCRGESVRTRISSRLAL